MAGAVTRNVELVLGSRSPRRLDLLRQIGIEPVAVDAADIDERPRRNEPAAALARRLAQAKLAEIVPRHPGRFVLSADTVVAVGRRLLGKPTDEQDARRHLALLSGRRHRVTTSVAVRAPDGRSAARETTTVVTFKRLQPDEFDMLMSSGEWQGKAGSYAIQGMAEAFIKRIDGSHSNVVGLPLQTTLALLRGLGWVSTKFIR
jgi:septum formation protein